jgi:hypothetical protein
MLRIVLVPAACVFALMFLSGVAMLAATLPARRAARLSIPGSAGARLASRGRLQERPSLPAFLAGRPQHAERVRSTTSPNGGRSHVPTTFPANAAISQSQPCRLPDAIPLKYAPMLQP